MSLPPAVTRDPRAEEPRRGPQSSRCCWGGVPRSWADKSSNQASCGEATWLEEVEELVMLTRGEAELELEADARAIPAIATAAEAVAAAEAPMEAAAAANATDGCHCQSAPTGFGECVGGGAPTTSRPGGGMICGACWCAELLLGGCNCSDVPCCCDGFDSSIVCARARALGLQREAPTGLRCWSPAISGARSLWSG